MAKVGTSNQDRTISLKAAVRSCINKKKARKIYCLTFFLKNVDIFKTIIYSGGRGVLINFYL